MKVVPTSAVSSVAKEDRYVACPNCLGRLFMRSAVQILEPNAGTIWVCKGCGKDFFERELLSKTPPGCLLVTRGEPVR